MTAPYKIWGSGLEPGCIEQLDRACSLPISVRGALMSDGHVGYNFPWMIPTFTSMRGLVYVTRTSTSGPKALIKRKENYEDLDDTLFIDDFDMEV